MKIKETNGIWFVKDDETTRDTVFTAFETKEQAEAFVFGFEWARGMYKLEKKDD